MPEIGLRHTFSSLTGAPPARRRANGPETAAGAGAGTRAGDIGK